MRAVIFIFKMPLAFLLETSLHMNLDLTTVVLQTFYKLKLDVIVTDCWSQLISSADMFSLSLEHVFAHFPGFFRYL